MSIYSFLASLPALLGILGFVIYQVTQSQGKGDAVTSKIVEKLRIDQPEKFRGHSKLNSKQLFALLERDNALRENISNQDFLLLQQTLKQQFQTNILVYSICAFLFIVGAALFVYQSNKPEPLSVTTINVSSAMPEAKGLAVDLDNQIVSWSSSGEAKDLTVYLENLDSRVRSDVLTVRSTNGQVEFLKKQFDNILSNRNAFQWNRIRAVIVSPEETFFSDEFKFYVGVTILALPFEEKVKIVAMVDNASVNGYDFDAMLVVWHKDGTDTTSFRSRISNGQRDFLLEDYSIMDWGNSKLGYLGPDDNRVVRTQILYD